MNLRETFLIICILALGIGGILKVADSAIARQDRICQEGCH